MPNGGAADAPDLPQADPVQVGSQLAGEVSEPVIEEPALDQPASEDAESSEAAPKRRRKRRSLRKKKKSPEPIKVAGEGDFSSDESQKGPNGGERAAAESKTPAKRQGDEDKPAQVSRTAKASHRAIPTWEDAVGVLISINLESRSKKSGGGSPRGRSKGRGAGKGRGSAKKSRESK